MSKNITPKKILNNIEAINNRLLELGIAALINNHHIRNNRLIINTSVSGAPPFSNDEYERVSNYAEWIADRQYSIIFKDGGLTQISYEVERNEVVGHRLCFIPAPHKIDFHDFMQTGLIFQEYLDFEIETKNPFLKSITRFDFAPLDAKDNHPAVHLTFNDIDCRIACKNWISPLRFMEFILHYFYSSEVASIPNELIPNKYNYSLENLSDLSRENNSGYFDESTKSHLHITWP